MSTSARPRRRGRPRKQPPPVACVCRVCMRQGDAMAPLHDAVEKLVFCTGLQIVESDGLPEHICDSCSCLLDSAYLFKTTCLNSDAALRGTVKLQGHSDQEQVHSDRDDDGTLEDRCGVKERAKKRKENGMDSRERECEEIHEQTAKRRGRKKKKKRDAISEVDNFDGTEIFSKMSIKLEPLVDIEESLVDVIAEKPCENRPGVVRRGAGGRRRPLCCDICDIKFQDAAAARRHANTEHKEDPSCVCEYCGKVFEHRSSHYYHMRSHLPPAFSCDQCAYSTWHKHDLVKHKRIHTDLKQYQCEFCSAAYHAVSNLRSHIRRTHERRRDHACPLCAHAFFDKRKLLQHLDSHNEIKRYTCNVCGAALSRRNYWARHMLRQHGVHIETPRPGRQKTNYVVGETGPPAYPVVGPIETDSGDSRLADRSDISATAVGLGKAVQEDVGDSLAYKNRSEIANVPLVNDNQELMSTVGVGHENLETSKYLSEAAVSDNSDVCEDNAYSRVVPLCKEVSNTGVLATSIDCGNISLALPKDLNIAIVAKET